MLIGENSTGKTHLLKVLYAAVDTLKTRQSFPEKLPQKGEEFFLKNKQGDLEFTLLSEGLRKLGLIWLLLQNGTLLKGSILFWDEPEANLNPKLIHTVVEVLLAFQRMGVQIFLATHNYVILKELELQREEADCVQFYSLHKDQGTIKVSSSATLYELAPNAINDTFDDMLRSCGF